MPSRVQRCVLTFAGGYATDFGPSFTGAPDRGALPLPWLLTADNVYYELDGAPHKIGGASLLNAAQVTEGGVGMPVHGLVDYWSQGVAGSEVQKRFAYIGTRLMKEDLDGVWDVLTTGLENNKQPCFEVFSDLLWWASTSNVDVPQTWDGAAGTTTVVGGSPPNFAFMVGHHNRLFAAGVASNPSRLYYSAFRNGQDWTGSGSGAFDVGTDDGDRIVGLASHKRELFIFKGPNQLSIHRLTGTSPEDFVLMPYVRGVGGVNHTSILRIGDDLVFASPRGLHSLAATAAYGDYIEAFLSRPITTFYQDLINHSGLGTIWGVNYQARGLALWTLPAAGGTAKNTYLVYDYRFSPGRWSTWGVQSAYVPAHCLAIVQNSARKHMPFAGTRDGYVYQLDTAARTMGAASAYTATVTTPFLSLGSSASMKYAEGIWHSFQPKGAYSFDFGWSEDTNAELTATVSQAGNTDTLG